MKTSQDAKGLVSKRDCIDFVFVGCGDGYIVNDDKNGCLDINECETIGSLKACPSLSECINNEGSYRCQCNTGYEPKNGG